MRFPADFWWGASTAAYQVEGDNRGSALWDWERRKGWERSGAAANSWRLWRQDVDCLKRLNLNAYRFSVEWSRVQPAPDAWNEDALERYADMAGALRREGIRPIVCLHHFSEPAWLLREVPRGWRSEEVVNRFVRFAARVAGALKTHVQDWLTFNEPMVYLLWGYGAGHFPPGHKGLLTLERDFLGRGGLLDRVAWAHGQAAAVIREERPDARVGLAQNVAYVEPARSDPRDLEAVRDWDSFMHRRLLDLAVSAKALDFVGVNYYTRIYARKLDWPGVPLRVLPGYAELEGALSPFLFRLLGGRRGSRERTDMGWEVVPEGLERVVQRLWEAYHLPIVVTENGLADSTGTRREPFLRQHLAALGRAMKAGARVWGYLHWTLMDNYEWGSFKPRFGLYRVDRKNGYARIPAPGSDFYARVAATGEVPE
ncbi:MAG: glycoside hydrolase family 1 protein [Elusimicrobia bacterium]|nr:glycoside hydrolase family 1 protein [Elusimicrobiota bacterium]